MKRLLLVAVLLTFALPATAGAKPAASDGCARKGADLLAGNRVAAVYERGGDLYGCLRRTRRWSLLARSYEADLTMSEAWDRVTLAGSFVAFRNVLIDASCKADCPPGYDGVFASIESVDLRTRRRRSVSIDGPPEWLGASETGGMAYLLEGGELLVADGLGHRLLDRGASRPRIAGSRLRWTSGGAPRDTLLAGGVTCQPRRGATRAWDDVGRAYDRGGVLYGCRWLRSRSRRLTAAPHDHVEMAGRFVAWSEPGTVVVRDLLSGREVRPAAAGVIELAMGGEGTVAWVQADGRLLATRGTEGHELASGGVEPGSLVVRGGTVAWRQDGVGRVARP